MTSDELDRALEEALRVEPPVGYLARVRARVAAEQTATATRYTWRPIGAMAAAGVVLVVGGLLLERDDDHGRLATNTATVGTVSAPGTSSRRVVGRDVVQVPTVTRNRGASAVPLERRPGHAADDAGNAAPNADRPAALLISPDDSEGLRLLRALPEAALAVPVIESAGPQTPQFSRIDVSPIQLDPLAELTPLTLGELQ